MSPDIRRLAAESMGIVKAANHRPVELGLDPSLPGMSGRGAYANGRRIIQTGGY